MRIFVASDLITQLAMQAHQFAIARNLFTGQIPDTCLSCFRSTRAIVLASRRSVLARRPRCAGKLMGLSGDAASRDGSPAAGETGRDSPHSARSPPDPPQCEPDLPLNAQAGSASGQNLKPHWQGHGA
jgi:hypothetical protein